MTKGLGFGAQPAGHACEPPPAKAAARTEEPHDASEFIAKTIVPHSPPHSSERLLHSACYGLPLPGDGRVGRRRHRWTQLVGVLTYYRSFPGGFAMVRFGLHGGAEFYASFACSLRALRPSIYTEVAGGRSRRCGEKRRDTPGPARSSLRRGRKRFGNSDYTFYLCA